ncbi:hypothetical protein K435DRAFT_964163 [Dendrothele bispora CBS 962.96]|uniref:Uncharacterized protein n=1 Tax=Dendrothele bispora (strain CBS 962.96) TaxID=1314807 RepID=A0A4S8MCE7_DENBC|nr:hypothetical protein K435DRAFT_964163 [Dendrothele bispora CBS 962.96]
MSETAAASVSPTPRTPPSWSAPHQPLSYFPNGDSDRLVDDSNWVAWEAQIINGAKVCKVLGHLNGTSVRPESPGAAQDEWDLKDASLQSWLMKCLKPSLIPQISKLSSCREIYAHLQATYSTTGSGTLMYWARALLKPMKADDDVHKHCEDFLNALQFLEGTSWVIPQNVASILLLITLYADPADNKSWYTFVEKQNIKTETKVANVVNAIKEALLAHRSSDSSSGSGQYFCTICHSYGHDRNYCRQPGGGKYDPNRKEKGKGKKRKGKEKAHATSDGNEESTHVVLEKMLSVSETSSLAYSHFSSSSTDSSEVPDEAFPTSHIHSICSDFTSCSSTTGSVSGFGTGTTRIQGWGEWVSHAQHPKGGVSKLKLQDTCFIPDSSPSLISVPRLNDAKCYTIFGNGRCICFEKDDHGQLLKSILSDEKVIFTGSRHDSRQYSLDTPDTDSTYYTHSPPVNKLEALHRRFGFEKGSEG